MRFKKSVWIFYHKEPHMQYGKTKQCNSQPQSISKLALPHCQQLTNKTVNVLQLSCLLFFFNKGKIFLIKYPSCKSITIDPESSRDGIFWPRMSMVMDGHCKTALLRTTLLGLKGHCMICQCSKDFLKLSCRNGG